jgi:cullin-4
MAKDIDLSNDLIAAYKEHRSHTDVSDGFDLTTNVLTTGNWPSFTPANVILPPDMTSALDRFKLFYGVKYTGRTLTWQHSLDQCVLKAAFPKGKKELAVSLFQALVLMLFNGMPDTAKLGFKDIMTSTGLGALAFSPAVLAKTRQNAARLSEHYNR